MNNYDKMREAARLHFLEYDYGALCRRPGVTAGEEGLTTRFLGQEAFVSRRTGEITVAGEKANFSQSLTIYDWLCDSKPGARAAERFCKISSLPGVLLSGSGLTMDESADAPLIEANREKFLALCREMEGRQTCGADLAVVIRPFPDLPMLLKFYEADEEFPATLSFLWDENTLSFLRYETIYYLAGCLRERLRAALRP